MQDDIVISKFLSFILRHKPESIELALDAEGWADIDSLLRQANLHGHPLSAASLYRVVETSDKKRFTLSPDSKRIRAAQGHSLKTVDLCYEPKVPPDILYHGTAKRFFESILEHGILSGKRQYVHLSTNLETALEVGKRYGPPIAIEVDAFHMYGAGCYFYHTENGIWLTHNVPAEFLHRA